jgi:Flp pilus assembly protein TadD
MKKMLQKQIQSPPEPVFFWQRWQNPYKALYICLLGFFLLTLAAGGWAYTSGRSRVMAWETESRLAETKSVAGEVVQGLLRFPVEANNYLVISTFNGSLLKVNETAGFLWLIAFLTGLLVLVSIATTLPRLWYSLGMTGLVLILLGMRLENLQLFGWHNQVSLGLVLLLILPVSYYLHAYRPDILLPRRMLVFTALTLLIILIFSFFSRNVYPVAYLVAYGTLPAVGLSLLFILLVSHEIVIGMLSLTSQSGSRWSLLHFVLLAFFYLLNLAALFLRNSLSISFKFFYLDAFLLLAVSAAVGIWGWKRQGIRLANILPFAPLGALAYLGLGTIGFATIGYFFATANDPMLEMLEDTIVMLHLGLGAAFTAYVLVNFSDMMLRGKPAYKIAYQPQRMMSFIARGGGLVLVFILFLRTENLPYLQAFAGYYNNLGDLYATDRTSTENEIASEAYYKLALTFTNARNHKANYALASLAKRKNNTAATIAYLQDAFLKQPTPQAYAALANVYQAENQFFPAVFTLQEGLRAFPGNPELSNNLALLYASKSVTDSVAFYFGQAEKKADVPVIIESNMLALQIQQLRFNNPDSVFTVTEKSKSTAMQANRLALVNIFKGQAIAFQPVFPKDTLLTRESFALWFNYALNQRLRPDTVLSQNLKRLAQKSENQVFQEDLTFAWTLHEYFTGDKSLALNQMSNLRNTTVLQKSYFNRVLGLWCMEQQAYGRAIEYFETASREGDTLARLPHALVYAETGKFGEGLIILSQKPVNQLLAQTLQTVLQLLSEKNALSKTQNLNDEEKTWFVHLSREPGVAELAKSIQNPDLRAVALAEVSVRLSAQNKLAETGDLLKVIPEKGLNPVAEGWRNFAKVHWFLQKKDFKTALAEMDKVSFPPEKETDKLFLRAIAYQQAGDLKNAEGSYRQALRQLPMREEVIAEAGAFFNQVQKPQEAYNVLLSGIQYNPYSVVLQKAYILQALELWLVRYAEIGLEDLKLLATPADYQAFLPLYQAKKALIQKRRDAF